MYKQLTRLPYIICYLCAFALGMKQLNSPDIWMHLASGRWMLEHGSVATTDVFSFTAKGSPWVNTNWLFQFVIAILEKVFGPHGTMLLQSLVNVAVVFLLLRTLLLFAVKTGEQVSTFFSVIAVIAVLALAGTAMTGGPAMMSLLFTALFMYLLWNADDYSWKKIWWLIPLQCVWANMHEGFIIGLLLVASYVIGNLITKSKAGTQPLLRLGIVLLGMGLVTLANPYGIGIWNTKMFTAPVADKFSDNVFAYSNGVYWTSLAIVHHVLFMLAVLYWGYRFRQNKKGVKALAITPALGGYLVALLVLELLSLALNTNIPFAATAVFPTIPLALVAIVQILKLQKKDFYIKLAKKTAMVSAVPAAIFYIAIVSNKFYKATASTATYGLHISPMQNPTNAVDFIRTNNLKGPAFSDHTIAPYLLWELYPQYKAYIDTRGKEVYSSKLYKNYLELNNNAMPFNSIDSQYKFNYLIFRTTELLPLQYMHYWGEGYNVTYVDPVCVIMVRNNKENEMLNHSPAAGKLFTWPMESTNPAWADALTRLFNPGMVYEEEDEMYAPLYAAKYYNEMRNSRVSVKMLQSAINNDLSEDAEALAVFGQSYMMYADFTQSRDVRKGRWDTAAIYYNKALELDDKSYIAHFGMATLSLMNSDFAKAKKHLDDCLELKKTDDYLYFLDGFCARNLWQAKAGDRYIDDVINSMEKCLEISDSYVKAHLYLAEAYWAKKDVEKARMHMRKLSSGEDLALSNYEGGMLEKLKKQTGVYPKIKAKDLLPAGGHNHDHTHAH